MSTLTSVSGFPRIGQNRELKKIIEGYWKGANDLAAVKATAAGVVTKLYVDEGDILAAGTPIADILDRDHMKITLPFHSADAAAPAGRAAPRPQRETAHAASPRTHRSA